jgi:hypothetical protein
VLRKAQRLGQMWQHLGPGWLAQRLHHLLRLRSGYMRARLPAREWGAFPLSDLCYDPALADPEACLEHRRQAPPAFFFSPSDRRRFQPFFTAWDGGSPAALKVADDLEQGQMTYFGHILAETGFPPKWHTNALTGEQTPCNRHWSQIDDFAHGDIKVIWEPNRFAFAYALVRAYWRSEDERYPELFWRAVEDWYEQNPPQRGANWKCGQEISFRLMAWCTGLYGFLDSPATNPGRLAMLIQMIALSARRIEAHVGYALSQKNNHGISEGMGLWTAGLLFPELRSAARWQETGRQILEDQGQALIYSDGSFAQNSVNYHRLVLHDLLWSLRLGELHDLTFSSTLRDRVARACDWLYQIQELSTGRVPNYGPNDGALILPLNNCDYPDYRPVVQAVRYLTRGSRSYEEGAWDEDLLWLFGPRALNAPLDKPPQNDFAAIVGGYYTLRAREGLAFTRCATFRHRPGQADALHLDLWWKGQNIALDAGTYSYNAPPPWNGPLAHTQYHNTVTVDGLDQMERAGRFLWLPWLHGRCAPPTASPGGRLAYWEGQHDGYQRLRPPALHRRAIARLSEAHWLVLDLLDSPGEHLYRLHWLLADMPHGWDEAAGHLVLDTPAGVYGLRMGSLPEPCSRTLVRADAATPRGWRAPGYSSREAALSLALETRASRAAFWTLLGPEPYGIMVMDGHIEIQVDDWRAVLNWQPEAHDPLVIEMSIDGWQPESLRMRSCTSS